MRKIRLVLMTVVMLSGFMACGGGDSDNDSFVARDGEYFYDSNMYVLYKFINGRQELELVESNYKGQNGNMFNIPEIVTYCFTGNYMTFNGNGKTYENVPVSDNHSDWLGEYLLTRIGERAFQNNNWAEQYIEIPSTIKSIGAYAFSGLSHLKRLTIQADLQTIEPYTFALCGFEDFSVPKSVKKIGDSAFEGCKSLVQIVLPDDGVTSIGKRAFADCNGLSSIALPNGLVTIEDSAFQDCRKLAKIILPQSLRSIRQGAFLGDVSLTNVVLPEGLTDIGDGAFQMCMGLESITIPKSVKSIGKNVFDCGYTYKGSEILGSNGSLMRVTSLIEEPFPIPGAFNSKGDYTFLHDGKLLVPKGCVEKYKSTEGWKDIVHIEEIK